VEDGWRPLTPEEQNRAETLIDRASRKIRRRWPDVDDRITAGTLAADDVADVVAEMVQVAMTQTPGVSQESQGAGPFQQGVTYTNPNSRLYFTADMIEVFDGRTCVKVGWLG
jgi:hypothetical protein